MSNSPPPEPNADPAARLARRFLDLWQENLRRWSREPAPDAKAATAATEDGRGDD